MRILLATNHLGLGGSESYLITVAEQLDRLGHEVAIHSPEGGAGQAAAEERGLRTMVGEASLVEGEYEAAIVQDGAVCHRIAEVFPGLPQLFVAHSGLFDLQAPPQLTGEVGAVVALNDRIAERMRAMAVRPAVLRLRQPIATEHFVPRGPLPEAPTGALLLSNTPHRDRLEAIEGACRDAGIELRRLGGVHGQSTDVRPALFGSEIVIGYGRSVLEAMACGRAAYVYDWNGGDGWVTAETYPEIEADGFAGRSGRLTIDRDRMAADLREYSSAMGLVNHDLVIARHRADQHATELVEALRDMGATDGPPRDSLREMERLVRTEWRAQLDVHALRRENAALQDRLQKAEQVRLRTVEEVERARADGAASLVEGISRTRRAYEGSLSWRMTRPLRALAALLRALRRPLGR